MGVGDGEARRRTGDGLGDVPLGVLIGDLDLIDGVDNIRAVGFLIQAGPGVGPLSVRQRDGCALGGAVGIELDLDTGGTDLVLVVLVLPDLLDRNAHLAGGVGVCQGGDGAVDAGVGQAVALGQGALTPGIGDQRAVCVLGQTGDGLLRPVVIRGEGDGLGRAQILAVGLEGHLEGRGALAVLVVGIVPDLLDAGLGLLIVVGELGSRAGVLAGDGVADLEVAVCVVGGGDSDSLDRAVIGKAFGPRRLTDGVSKGSGLVVVHGPEAAGGVGLAGGHDDREGGAARHRRAVVSACQGKSEGIVLVGGLVAGDNLLHRDGQRDGSLVGVGHVVAGDGGRVAGDGILGDGVDDLGAGSVVLRQIGPLIGPVVGRGDDLVLAVELCAVGQQVDGDAGGSGAVAVVVVTGPDLLAVDGDQARRVGEAGLGDGVVGQGAGRAGGRLDRVAGGRGFRHREAEAHGQIEEAGDLAVLEGEGQLAAACGDGHIGGGRVGPCGVGGGVFIIMVGGAVLCRCAAGERHGEGERLCRGGVVDRIDQLLHLQPAEAGVGEVLGDTVAGFGRGHLHAAVSRGGNGVSPAAALDEAVGDGIAVDVRAGQTGEQVADGPGRGLSGGDGDGLGLVDGGVVSDVQIKGQRAGLDRALPALLHVDGKAGQVVFQREHPSGAVPDHVAGGILALIGAVGDGIADVAVGGIVAALEGVDREGPPAVGQLLEAHRAVGDVALDDGVLAGVESGKAHNAAVGADCGTERGGAPAGALRAGHAGVGVALVGVGALIELEGSAADAGLDGIAIGVDGLVVLEELEILQVAQGDLYTRADLKLLSAVRHALGDQRLSDGRTVIGPDGGLQLVGGLHRHDDLDDAAGRKLIGSPVRLIAQVDGDCGDGGGVGGHGGGPDVGGLDQRLIPVLRAHGLIVIADVGGGVVDHGGDAEGRSGAGVHALQHTLPAVHLTGMCAGVGRVLQHVVDHHVLGGTGGVGLQSQLVLVGALQVGDVRAGPRSRIALDELEQAVLRSFQDIRLDCVAGILRSSRAIHTVAVRVIQRITAVIIVIG